MMKMMVMMRMIDKMRTVIRLIAIDMRIKKMVMMRKMIEMIEIMMMMMMMKRTIEMMMTQMKTLVPRTVRIWDYTQDACINVLSGHTAPVRGLMWNTEVPYLLTSGSWDYTIRVWDTRDGTCLDTVYDHGADVYGTETTLTADL